MSAGLWDYACALYGRPGVQAACLDVQDRSGLDVTLLLFCCWAAARGAPALSPALLREVHARTRPWADEVTAPLRALRRRLAAGPAEMPLPERQHLRGQVQAVELEAERIALGMIERMLEGPMPAGAPSRATARANLAIYVAVSGVTPDAAATAALECLLAAAFPEDGAPVGG
jgi:uncharacterized protein (TIGR02444 family)